MRSGSGIAGSCQGAPSSASVGGAITSGSSFAASAFDSGVTLSSSEIMPANRPLSQVRCSGVNGADSGISDGIGGRGAMLILPPPVRPWI